MVALNKKYADKGVQCVGVSLDKATDKAKMLKIAADKGFAWPQQFPGMTSAKEWGVNTIPQTFVIDGSGEVLWRGHPAELDSHLEEAVSKLPAKGEVKGEGPTTQPSSSAK
jgi:peroxiredoxin